MTLLRLAIRSHRTGAIAMAAIGAIAGLLNGVGFEQLVGTSPLERHAFATQMELLGRQLTYLLPAPVQLDTMGGYLTWRAFGTVALVYVFWALLAGTGAARGDEERGLVEEWLSAGVSRVRWLATRTGGFAIALALSIFVTTAATAAGAALVNDPLGMGDSLLEGIALYTIALFGFGVGVALSQLVVTRRVASSLGAIVIIALYVLNDAARSGIDIGAIGHLSPFYLYDRSTPLLAGGTFDVGANLALLIATGVLLALGAIAFARRDLGGTIVRLGGNGQTRPTARPSRDPLLRLPVLAGVDQQRWWTAGWAIGISLLAYLLTSLTRGVIDTLSGIPSLRPYVERLGLVAYSDFIGVIWFSSALLILSILVIVQVNGWAADDAEGRLETMLSTGASRPRVVVERIAALLVSVGIVAAASTAVVAIAARAFDIDVPGDRLVIATVLMLPVAFAFAAVGHALVGWRPRVAVLLLGIVAVVSYFTQEFAPLFSWPDWVKNTSFFALYGMPMTTVDWGGAITLLAIGVFGTAAAIMSMQRRDVGT
jgi:ABC-2 type transport system permease protein